MIDIEGMVQEVSLLVEELMEAPDKILAVERMMTAASLLRDLCRLLDTTGHSREAEIRGTLHSLITTLNMRTLELLCRMETVPTELMARWKEAQHQFEVLGQQAIGVGVGV